jgi:uracil-DNA glycosylase family 4
MTESIEKAWPDLRDRLSLCRLCLGASLHSTAQPLFGRFRPRKNGVLFVFEAPNRADTEDEGKQYITYDKITDSTGKFTEQLFREQLGIGWQDFQVTNAVLCLPKRNPKGAYPVQSSHLKNCNGNLRAQINVLEPKVVVPVGGEAIRALARIERLESMTLRQIVARPLQWYGRWLFPLFHTSSLGRANRSPEQQEADWSALAVFLRDNEVALR